MLTTILIATIIHMNIGFKLPEALWRGVGSAAIIAGVTLVGYLVIIAIAGIYSAIVDRK